MILICILIIKLMYKIKKLNQLFQLINAFDLQDKIAQFA